MKIIATKIKAKELNAGDLFSIAGQDHWDNIGKLGELGQRVFIRTETPTPPDQADEDIYRITVYHYGHADN